MRITNQTTNHSDQDILNLAPDETERKRLLWVMKIRDQFLKFAADADAEYTAIDLLLQEKANRWIKKGTEAKSRSAQPIKK